jgi:hypothetical protein
MRMLSKIISGHSHCYDVISITAFDTYCSNLLDQVEGANLSFSRIVMAP